MKSHRSSKRKPTHPGAILREDVFPALKLSQAEIALAIGVSRRTISELLNERRAMTADMALRLAHFLGGSPTSWLNMQQMLDLWLLETKNSTIYNEIKRAS